MVKIILLVLFLISCAEDKHPSEPLEVFVEDLMCRGGCELIAPFIYLPEDIKENHKIYDHSINRLLEWCEKDAYTICPNYRRYNGVDNAKFNLGRTIFYE